MEAPSTVTLSTAVALLTAKLSRRLHFTLLTVTLLIVLKMSTVTLSTATRLTAYKIYPLSMVENTPASAVGQFK